jgi:hypothetical protein
VAQARADEAEEEADESRRRLENAASQDDVDPQALAEERSKAAEAVAGRSVSSSGSNRSGRGSTQRVQPVCCGHCPCVRHVTSNAS